MQFPEIFLAHYGSLGAVLALLILVLLCVQLWYYLFAYGRIPSYRNNRRLEIRQEDPAVSVVIPLFSEDYAFVEERLPLILAQEYADFEVVLVYVGADNDFYEDLLRLRLTFPQVCVTKIQLDPRFPISRKMALNVGIKSAHNECLLFTSADVVPDSDRWLSLMAQGFRRGEIVVGYCGIERRPGMGNFLMRCWRMMHSANWLARAVKRHPYRGTLHNLGFTKRLYFGVNGFSHLNMNIGEDDLFMQRVMTSENVSIVLSPRAALCEKPWGGFRWWLSTERYFGSAEKFYPRGVRFYQNCEPVSRLLFFVASVCAIVLMPLEFKIAAAALLLLRYLVVVLEVRRVARRLGETGIVGRYFLYDLLSPLLSLLLGIVLLRKDERVWR